MPSNHLIVLPSSPAASESYSAADEEIGQGISLAQENLLRQQKPDGHWRGELLVDSTLCSDYVVFMHWCGEVDAHLQRRCVRHILKRQLPDGGWNIYHGGPSEINASVKAYFALKLAGCSVDAPFMQEARATIMRLGGIPQMNTFSKLYLALLGVFPWKYLPAIPIEMVLLPSWAPFHIYKMSSWSRAMLIPLSIINHVKPTRILPGEKQLHELYPLGTEQADLRLPRSENFWTWRNFFLRLDDTFKFLQPLRIGLLRQRAMEAAERWMLERIREGSDGLAAVYPAMLNSMIALRALGYSKQIPFTRRLKTISPACSLTIPRISEFNHVSRPFGTQPSRLSRSQTLVLHRNIPHCKKRPNGWSTRKCESAAIGRSTIRTPKRAAGRSNTTTSIIRTLMTPRWC